MEEYKINQVIKLLDINKSRVQYYYDTGVIVPLRDSQGPGTHRYFSRRNIAEIYLAMTLTKLGVGIRMNAAIIQTLEKIEQDIIKDYIKDKILEPGERISFIEPHTPDFKQIMYLTIASRSADDPWPEVEILAFDEDEEKPKILDLDHKTVEESMSILLVNLTNIKLILEDKVTKPV